MPEGPGGTVGLGDRGYSVSTGSGSFHRVGGGFKGGVSGG